MQKFSSTMKASSRRTSRNKRIKTIFIVGFTLLFLVIVLPRVVNFASALVFTPISYIQTWTVGLGNMMPAYFQDRQELIQHVNELENTIAMKETGTNSIKRLQEENRELRALFQADDSDRIVAGVIGRPNVTPYDVLLIDRGSDDEIVESAPVYSGADRVIGFVERVYAHSAVVVLATTPNYRSTVYVYGPNIYTTARGLGGGVLEISVPQGIEIAENDLVVMPSVGAGIYGEIGLVESIPSEPEQRGYVTSGVPLHSLRIVSVGASPISEISFDEARSVIEEARASLLSVPVPSGVLVEYIPDVVATATASTTNDIAE